MRRCPRRRSLRLGSRRVMRNLALLFGTLWLASCAVGPNYHRPDVKVAEKFEGATQPAPVQTGTAVQPATYSQEEAVAQFWTQFNDATLNSLIADALEANHDL